MNTHNFTIGPTDTDSISFCKENGQQFTPEEIDSLLKEINDISPEFMTWDNDGYYKTCIVVKAKNYVLWDGKKLVIKGSSLKASTKCPALKQFIKDIIQSIIDEKYNYIEIYEAYVKEIINITDISRWAIRKTVTDKVLNGTRTNETKVLAAIASDDPDSDEIMEGDKVYVYYKQDDSLATVDKFDGKDYNMARLLQNLYDSAKCFSTIIPLETFINYKLKRNQELLAKFKNI